MRTSQSVQKERTFMRKTFFLKGSVLRGVRICCPQWYKDEWGWRLVRMRSALKLSKKQLNSVGICGNLWEGLLAANLHFSLWEGAGALENQWTGACNILSVLLRPGPLSSFSSLPAWTRLFWVTWVLNSFGFVIFRTFSKPIFSFLFLFLFTFF